MLTIILLLIVAFIASTIASITGFGSAAILIPFVALVIDLKRAIILVSLFHFFSNAFRLLRLRQFVSWRIMASYGLPGILTAYGGAMLLERLNIEAILIIFVGFIITFAIYSLINPLVSLPDNSGVLLLGGMVSGFTAGLIGLGGAIRSMFLISTKLRKEGYVATSAAIAVVFDITRLSVYAYNGNLDTEYYWYVIPLIIIAFAGTTLGIKLLEKLPGMMVRRLVLIFLILVGINMLLRQYRIY